MTERSLISARKCAPFALTALMLFGCSSGGKDVVLEGDREPVRSQTFDATGALTDEAPRLGLAGAKLNETWPHQNGAPSQAAPHVSANYPLKPLWSASLGRGNSGKAQITSGPIVAEGHVFAMDATGVISAFTLDGAPAWQVDMTPPNEDRIDGFGGGLTYGKGVLIATSGFSKVVALSPESGEILWEQALDAPARAPGVIASGRVFVVARDNQAYAIDLKNGRIRWRLEGIEPGAAMLGGAAPAVSRGLVVMPMASGEVVGALARNGRRVWTSLLAGGRRGTVRGRIDDITGDPVIHKGAVYVANQSGRLVSLDQSTGARNWVLNEGAAGPVLPAGNALFFVNDLAQLKRVNRFDGETIWSVQLPAHEDADRGYVVDYNGPLMIGERLVVGSGQSGLMGFDPATGAALGQTGGPRAGVIGQPAVAGGRVFAVTTAGTLEAYE